VAAAQQVPSLREQAQSLRIPSRRVVVSPHRVAARAYLNEMARGRTRKTGRRQPARRQIFDTINFFPPSLFREALLDEIRERALLKPWPQQFRQLEVAR